jgi:hypothetical protein
MMTGRKGEKGEAIKNKGKGRRKKTEKRKV